MMEVFADFACQLGEGVLWHPRERAVYFVDIDRGRLYRDRELLFQDSEPIGGFAFGQDGSVLLFGARGRVKRLKAGKAEILTEVEESEERFNDVIATPDGRVLAGHLSGRVWRLDPDGSARVVLENVAQPNGMGFSPDGHWLYLTETHKQTIHRYAYADGELSEGTPFIVTEGEEGGPDGLTVDGEGSLWSARWDGSVAIRYTDEGVEVDRLKFPARKITSLSFGEGTTLFASTAGGEEREQDGPQAGCVFETNAGVHGKPEYFARL